MARVNMYDTFCAVDQEEGFRGNEREHIDELRRDGRRVVVSVM